MHHPRLQMRKQRFMHKLSELFRSKPKLEPRKLASSTHSLIISPSSQPILLEVNSYLKSWKRKLEKSESAPCWLWTMRTSQRLPGFGTLTYSLLFFLWTFWFWDNDCYGLNYVPHKFICWSSNLRVTTSHLRLWSYLVFTGDQAKMR